MAITKLVLLLVTATAQHYAITPPNARPLTEELREQGGSESVIPYFTAFVKVLVWSWVALEGFVLFALSDYYSPAYSRLVLDSLSVFDDPTSLATLARPTPAFVIGALLSVAGALLRAHTFRVLGTRFTFELSIRGAGQREGDDPTLSLSSTPTQTHALVTDGVYGIVRHPSYTGAVALALGFLLCFLDRHGTTVLLSVQLVTSLLATKPCPSQWSSVAHVGILNAEQTRTPAMVTATLACAWTTAVVVLSAGLHARMAKEDAMLQEHFGETWRAWVERVPWRLVPGVY